MFDRPLHGQELKLSAMEVDLHSMQCLISKSIWMIPSDTASGIAQHPTQALRHLSQADIPW